jgi:hypothetical protein
MPLVSDSDSLQGIGGSITPWATNAGISFVHEDGSLTIYDLLLRLIIDPSSAELPAVLGRDILFSGRLSFDPTAGQVLCDAPVGRFAL